MNIYVGNLPYNMSDEQLQQLFGKYGSVSSASVIKDNYTGKSKGFGFVEMEKKEDAEEAINGLNDTPLENRNIKVNMARPRTERSSKPPRSR